jgi:predicted transglutaminase-like cysteine proteinase
MPRALFVLFFALALLTLPNGARAGDLFGLNRSGADFSQFPFWNRVMADMAATQTSDDAIIPASLGSNGPQPACADERHCAPAAWNIFLATLRDKPRREQIEAVNHWANQQPYVEDTANWGVADYWETPGEFLAHGGDCEDFAIAKYFSLTRLGVPADDLRIMIVQDQALGVFHAVLAVRDQGQTLLLDNQLAEATPLSAVPQYQMVYALNAQGWWLASPPRIEVGAVIIVAAGSAKPR